MLTVLDLGPDSRERGLAHGRAMPRQIADNVETYLARFEEGGSKRKTVLEQGEAWADLIKRDNPEYAVEMGGIAEGARLSLGEIGMLNARYEITYCLFASEADTANRGLMPEQEGCTSFGLLPEATKDGHTVMGQNWDWLERVHGRTFIMRVKRSETFDEGKPSFIGFTEAGIAGCKMGLNTAGIGLCVNGIVTAREGANPFRKPFHVRCREILDAWAFDKALLPVIENDRTCSANFVIGHADGEIIDIEATPDFYSLIHPDDGMLTHANHLLKEMRVKSEFERISPSTLFRSARLDRLMRKHHGRLDLELIKQCLGDRFSAPMAICRTADPKVPAAKRTITVATIVLDLTERVLYASDGPLTQAPLQTFTLDAARQSEIAA